MKCKNCGAKIPNDSPFCTVCGKDFDSPPIDAGAPPESSFPRSDIPHGFGAQPFGRAIGSAFAQMPPMPKRNYKKAVLSVLLTVAIVAGIALFVYFDLTSNKKQILGIWRSDGTYTRFNENGTVEPALGETDARYNYKIDGDELKISIGGNIAVYRIVKLNNDTLTLEYPTGDDTVTFDKVYANDSQVDEIINKGKLRAANKTAKIIYQSLNSGIESSTDQPVITNKPLDVSTLKNSDDPIRKKVYDTMKNLSWGNHGYVIIHFDPTCSDDGTNNNFIQWSETEDGKITGQYPDPIPEDSFEMVRFGKRFKK